MEIEQVNIHDIKFEAMLALKNYYIFSASNACSVDKTKENERTNWERDENSHQYSQVVAILGIPKVDSAGKIDLVGYGVYYHSSKRLYHTWTVSFGDCAFI